MDVAMGRWLFASVWVDADALPTCLILPRPPPLQSYLSSNASGGASDTHGL